MHIIFNLLPDRTFEEAAAVTELLPYTGEPSYTVRRRSTNLWYQPFLPYQININLQKPVQDSDLADALVMVGADRFEVQSGYDTPDAMFRLNGYQEAVANLYALHKEGA